MKAARLLLLTIIFLVLSSHSFATKVSFTVEFDSGPLEGQVAHGSYEVDGPAFGGYSPSSGLLSFNIVVDEVLFSIFDDEAFPDLPVVASNTDMGLLKLDYWARLDEIDEDISLSLFIHSSGAHYVRFSNAKGEDSYGNFTQFFILEPDIAGKFKLNRGSSPLAELSSQELHLLAQRHNISVRELLLGRGNKRSRCSLCAED